LALTTTNLKQHSPPIAPDSRSSGYKLFGLTEP